MESLLTIDRLMEFIGFSVGLLYIWWEYHANPKMWVAGVVMPAISFWVYYRAGLYADFAMNIYYFLIAIYGWRAWTRGGRRGKQLPISRIPLRVLGGCLVAFLGVYALIAYWLVAWTDSTVPYLDAFTTAMSIVATWMLARKYIEQWWAWVLVDSICVGLYIYKDRYFYAILYAIYTIIAILGYRKWKKEMEIYSQKCMDRWDN